MGVRLFRAHWWIFWFWVWCGWRYVWPQLWMQLIRRLITMSLQDTLRPRREKEHKVRKHRDLLVDSVRTLILPALINQGFSPSPKKEYEQIDRKDQGTFPFGLLRRARADGGIDLVEIQFMTYQRAAFRINASAVPKAGMITLGGHRKADEL